MVLSVLAVIAVFIVVAPWVFLTSRKRREWLVLAVTNYLDRQARTNAFANSISEAEDERILSELLTHKRKRPNRKRKAQRLRAAKQHITWHQRLLREEDHASKK